MTNNRVNSIEIDKEAFRKIGHQLIDDISDFIASIDKKPVTANDSPGELQELLGNNSLPENGHTIIRANNQSNGFTIEPFIV